MDCEGSFGLNPSLFKLFPWMKSDRENSYGNVKLKQIAHIHYA